MNPKGLNVTPVQAVGGQIVDQSIDQTHQQLAQSVAQATGQPQTTQELTPTPEQALHIGDVLHPDDKRDEIVGKTMPDTYKKFSFPILGWLFGKHAQKNAEHMLGADSNREGEASDFTVFKQEKDVKQDQALGKAS